MITNCEFDTIYHEHLSYFLVNSFRTLVERKGFYISDILQTRIHGGSIRFFLKKGNKPHCDATDKLIDLERKKGLLGVDAYFDFSKQVEKNKQDLIKALGRIDKVVGYGASAKGNTMLNYFGIDLDYIVDDNPLKWGYLTPGRDIPIKSPQTLFSEENLYIVILSWNFYEEIKRKIEQIRGKRQCYTYILYVPKVEMKS
jgi:hypothetical protein